MDIIPNFALSLVIAHLNSFLHWFSDLTYTELLKRDPDHLLVKVQGQVDLLHLEQACAPFHHISGPGAKPTHSVAHLVRAFLVKYLFDWSLRELEHHLRFDLLVKWFVGYPVFAAGPDHVTLERFEVWAAQRHGRTFFDDILRQIDAAFPDERRQSQMATPLRWRPTRPPRPSSASCAIAPSTS